MAYRGPTWAKGWPKMDCVAPRIKPVWTKPQCELCRDVLSSKPAGPEEAAPIEETRKRGLQKRAEVRGR